MISKRNRIIISSCLLLLFSTFQSCGNSDVQNEDKFVSCGHDELDKLRQDVIDNPTIDTNVLERRATVYRLWRLLWRQGINMSSFDSIANELIIIENKNSLIKSTLDHSFAILEQIISKPEFIEEVEGKPSNASTSKTNWPVYHGVDGSQNGYSPDLGPETGQIAWEFPKTNGWNAAPVLHDGRIYTAGAGTDVIGYSLDQKTGDIVWKGRTNSSNYYESKGAETTPQISKNSLIVKAGAKLYSFDLDSGKKKFATTFYDRTKNPSKFTPIINRYHNGISCNNPETGKLIWYFTCPNGVTSGEPAVTDNAVYISSTQNTCYKLDKKNGSIIWEKTFNKTIRGNTSFAGDIVTVGFKTGLLVALSPESGEEIWRFKSNQIESRAYDFYGAAISQNSKIYIGAADKYFYCLDAKSGKKLWAFEAKDWIRSKPVLVKNTIFFGDLSGMGYALNIANNTPDLIWQQPISDHGYTADIVGNEQGILFSDQNMMLTSVSPKTGKKQWIHSQLDGTWIKGEFFAAGEISGQQSSPTIVDGILYIASPDGFVNAVDTESGKELWKFETKSQCSTSPTVAEGKVFVGQTYNSYGEYFALDKDTGEPIWISKELGAVWISAAYANNKLFLGDMDGNFFAIDPNTGEKIWNYFTAKDTPDEHRPLDDHIEHGWPPGVYCNPITEGNVVYTGSWAGYYFAFDQETGKLLWRTKTQPEGEKGGTPDSSAPVLYKNHLYVQKGGYMLSAIDKKTGEIKWDWPAPPGFLQNGTVAARDNKVFASAVRQVTTLPYNSTIYAFNDVENGSEMLWKYKGGGGLTAPVFTKDKLIFGSSADPFVTCLNPDNGEVIWRTHVGGKMLESVPTIYGNKVFVLIKNGYLYAIK